LPDGRNALEVAMSCDQKGVIDLLANRACSEEEKHSLGFQMESPSIKKSKHVVKQGLGES
jgi:hypothetical protein